LDESFPAVQPLATSAKVSRTVRQAMGGCIEHMSAPGAIRRNPIGSKGVSMVDTRDIGETAALFLLKRENAAEPLPRETIELVGPDALTSEAIAGIWSEVLGRQIRYGGDDLAAFEKLFGSFAPRWMARDMRLMMSRFQQQEMVAKPEAVARLTDLLGHAPHSYRDFAAETAKQWQS
jgi:uncharacterized protein YbjT (DUF2867 family)